MVLWGSSGVPLFCEVPAKKSGKGAVGSACGGRRRRNSGPGAVSEGPELGSKYPGSRGGG